MTTYPHFQELKKAEKLPKPKQVGACLTCRFWQVEQARGEKQAPLVALCEQPKLKPFALIVSGSSACNAWKEKPGIAAKAKAYATRGEEG